jgi:hypothetical protein
MQAQDYPHSKWAVGLRCIGATNTTIERAIADRSIVRTWAMRGTLQLVAAEDVRWLLQLVGPRLIARAATEDLRRFELGTPEYVKIEKLLSELLRNKQMTRKEIYAALAQHGIKTDGQRGYHILARCALHGQICFGAWRGKEETFVLLDEWVPTSAVGSRDRDAAIVELAVRYFRSHGPATLQDYACWCGLPMAEVRAGLEGATSQLIQETIGGTTYWLPNDPSTAKTKPSDVHLLPGFDEYLLGYTDRSVLLQKVHKASVIHSNGLFKPTVVVAGQIVGVWGRRMVKGKLVVTPALFGAVAASAQLKIERAVQRYVNFVQAGG